MRDPNYYESPVLETLGLMVLVLAVIAGAAVLTLAAIWFVRVFP